MVGGPTTINQWFSYGTILAFLVMLSPHATATMYRCFDTKGAMVLTDSPAQLADCTVLDPKKPTAQMTKPPPRKSKQISRPPQGRTVAAPRQKEEATDNESAEDTADQDGENKDSTDNKPEPITVPVTKIGGSMVVQVLLNNSVDAHLIVDTGATMTVISYDLGIELGLLSGSDVSLNTVNTAGGSVQVSMTHVGTMQVGSAKASNVAVAIHDLPDGISGVSGLLGMSFLRNFEVTLDADRGLLRLLPKLK